MFICLAEIERERLYSDLLRRICRRDDTLVVRIEETDRGFDRPEWVLQVIDVFDRRLKKLEESERQYGEVKTRRATSL
jgi:hypothetical protein